MNGETMKMEKKMMRIGSDIKIKSHPPSKPK